MNLAWPLLRNFAYVLLGILAVCAALAGSAYAWRQSAEQAQNAARQAVLVENKNLEEAREDASTIDGVARRYQVLLSKLAIGETRRSAEWIDALQRSANDTGLQKLVFNLKETLPGPPHDQLPEGFEWFLTELRFEAEVLHEPMLMRMLADFQRDVPGLFRDARCGLSRMSSASVLRAACSMDFIALVAKPQEAAQ